MESFIICIASIKIKILSNNISLSICAFCPLSGNDSHVNFHMIYGLGLSKVDQVRSETARRGPEPGRAAKKGFSALLLIADGCQNCSHPHMHVWVSVFIRIQFEYLFTWHSSLPSSLSGFIYFLAMRLLLVAISSDRWPKKLKKKAELIECAPRESLCETFASLSCAQQQQQ